MPYTAMKSRFGHLSFQTVTKCRRGVHFIRDEIPLPHHAVSGFRSRKYCILSISSRVSLLS